MTASALRSATWSCLFALLAACSGSGSNPDGEGGAAGASSASGGSSSSGGSSAQGGAGSPSVATGGASTSGGAPSVTGGSATGGAVSGGSAGLGGANGGGQSGGGGSGGTGIGGVAGTAGTLGGGSGGGGASNAGGGMSGGGSGSGGGATSSSGGKSTGGAGSGGGKSSGGAGGASSGGGKSSGGSGGAGGSGGGACPFTGHITYTLAKATNPTAAQTTAYGLITTAMDKALGYYNCYTSITKSLNVVYEPSVQTADGNINGSLRFGSSTTYMDYRTAMHEIGHTVGVGQASNWSSFLANGLFTGANALAQLKAINATLQTPLYTEVHADTQHFWPYGLNQQSEAKSESDLIWHCQMVVAIRKDLGLQ